MSYSYYDKNNKIQDLNLEVGATWESVKCQNERINSIFTYVDNLCNGDGIIQEYELDLLNQLLQIADNTISSTAQDNVLDDTELENLQKLIDNTNKPTVINTENPPTMEDYSYIEIFDMSNDEKYAVVRDVDVSGVQPDSLESGEYYIDKEFKNGKMYAKAYKMQAAVNKDSNNWSEGVDRVISTIKVADVPEFKELKTVQLELQQIGNELGFNIERVYSAKNVWLEDYSIRRADSKIYLQPHQKRFYDGEKEKDVVNRIIQNRNGVSYIAQGAAAENGRTYEYAKTLPKNEIVNGSTYLEGGNVLNTCLSDGTPAAVIGEESIDYTLMSLGLENTEENVEIAKAEIAKDLGIDASKVTYIPQFDFHIDMLYRPLHNGEIAVPDFQEAIKILQETEIADMDETTRQKLIKALSELEEKTAPQRTKAIENLQKDGYKIVKIPCFSTFDKELPCINFMNGVGGTSKKGETFYITNKSEYPELDKIAETYFKQNNIDRVFFVSTEPFLQKCGGIDCLTQEI